MSTVAGRAALSYRIRCGDMWLAKGHTADGYRWVTHRLRHEAFHPTSHKDAKALAKRAGVVGAVHIEHVDERGEVVRKEPA